MKNSILSTFFFSFYLLSAQNGILDSSFGHQGHVIKTLNTDYGSGTTAHILPNNKILVGGYAGISSQQVHLKGVLHKYNADGTADTGFADQGEVNQNLLPNNWALMKLAVQPDGKIVASGHYDFSSIGLLARFHPDGTLDSSFGTDGVNIIDFSSTATEATYVSDLALLPDGKILICGYTDDGGTPLSYVARYTTAGKRDTSYGNFGINILPQVGIYEFYADGMMVRPDGKIVLNGSSSIWGGSRMMVVRLHANGNFDFTFGTNGVVRHALFSSEWLQKTILLPNQKMICVGSVGTNYADVFISNISSNGDLDSSYGTNGVLTFNLASGYSYSVADAHLLADNSVLISIRATFGSQTKSIVTRVLEDGKIDFSFGANGFIHPAFPGNSAYHSIAIVDHQSFVMSGFQSDSLGASLLLSKYVIKSYFSIAESSLPKTDFNIYPNPSSGILTIATKTPGVYTLYNNLGQQVWRGQINLEQSTLNLEHLSSGLYFMVDEVGTSQKIIIAKN